LRRVDDLLADRDAGAAVRDELAALIAELMVLARGLYPPALARADLAAALANIARHAHATTATVAVAIDAETLRLEIRDDGRGNATPARGLRGLTDRFDALGGRLTIDSPAGGPTVNAGDLPLVHPASAQSSSAS
jgi:signal transduction histidine kinase